MSARQNRDIRIQLYQNAIYEYSESGERGESPSTSPPGARPVGSSIHGQLKSVERDGLCPDLLDTLSFEFLILPIAQKCFSGRQESGTQGLMKNSLLNLYDFPRVVVPENNSPCLQTV